MTTRLKLAAFDFDGTLLDSRGRVPAANLEAIARVSARVQVIADAHPQAAAYAPGSIL